MKLHFDAAIVKRLLDHSKSVTSHEPCMDQLFDGRCRKDGKDVDVTAISFENWPTGDDVDRAKVPPGRVARRRCGHLPHVERKPAPDGRFRRQEMFVGARLRSGFREEPGWVV